MSLARAAALLVLIAPTLPALAQSPNCAKATTQADLDTCSGTAFAAADKTLNAAYRSLIATLTPGGQQRLRDAQRAWVAFRDRECDFRSNGADGGSAAPMVAADCRTTLTQARTKDLKALAACQEGDLSCPR